MEFPKKNIFGFEKYPKFQLDESRFPQDCFLGRWLHFNDMIDPRTLLVSQKSLDNAVELLNLYQNGKIPPNVTNEQLWRAQKIKQSTIHPDTGKKVFMPFRMSGYVPFGSPMVVGLLLPNPSMMSSVFWQWINQSHNACVNFANRNATKHTPTSKFIQGYCGAVTTAVSIAMGLTVLIRKAEHFKPATRMLIQRFVPLPAVCMASTCNVLLMRWHEKNTGIEVLNSEGEVVGTSKVAAKKALAETAATRAFLPAPIFFFPPLIMTQLEKLRFLKRNPKWHLPINAVVCTLAFALSLPIAISLFPQNSTISTHSLEKEIQKKTNEELLFYNKGL